MSVSTIPAVVTFATAQRAYVKGTENHVRTFVLSATACALAMRERGVTLQRLADANKELTSDIVCPPKGTLFVSAEGVAIHQLAGEVLLLAFDEDGADVDPFAVQTLVVKVKRDNRYGVKAIKAIVRRATSQQEAIAWMREALAVKVETADETATDETDESTDDETVTSTETVQTVESLLGRALAMLANGADVTDAVRGMVSDLISHTGPVAVPDAA